MINTQEPKQQRVGPKFLGSTIKDNKSVKSLVSGISVSIRTGNNQQLGAKSDF